MSYDHQPHILRPHLDEWCGGTEPPTIVTVDRDNFELAVDIFAPGSNLHVGEILEPTARELFLIENRTQLGPPEIGDYAVRALRAAVQQ